VSACAVEAFPALDELPVVRAAFLQRCAGIDVVTDRDTALARLWQAHRETADRNGFAGYPFAVAEQVHGAGVAVVDKATQFPVSGVDGLVTAEKGLALAIYVADCAAVYLVDRLGRGIGLVHSGKKGTELGVAPAAIHKMGEAFGCVPEDLVAQIAPCIRPPHYEIDFAAEIIRQVRACGVREVHDCETCTASHPELYYSYRREKGRTGRLLALLALKTPTA